MNEFAAEWYDDEKTILLLTYPKTFEASALIAWSNTELMALIDEVDHPVVLVTDANQAEVPRGILAAIPELRAGIKLMDHPQYVGQVFFNLNRLGEHAARLWALFDYQSFHADRFEAALEKARAKRTETLDKGLRAR